MRLQRPSISFLLFFLLCISTTFIPCTRADSALHHDHQKQDKQHPQHPDQPPQQIDEDHAYIAFFKAKDLGTKQDDILVRINGVATTDVLLHNSSVLSFRIPTTVLTDRNLFSTSYVEILLSSKPLTRLPLSVLEHAISKVNLAEWRLTALQSPSSSAHQSQRKDETNSHKIEATITPQSPSTANAAPDENIHVDGLIREAHDLLKTNKPYSNRKAVALLTEAHDARNYTSSTTLASIFLSSIPGVARDVARATVLLQAASEAGIPDAQALLGFLYASGFAAPYVPVHIGAALLLWRFAADGGAIIAKIALAYRYFRGVDLPESCLSAAALYRDVADEVYVDILHAENEERARMAQKYQQSSKSAEPSPRANRFGSMTRPNVKNNDDEEADGGEDDSANDDDVNDDDDEVNINDNDDNIEVDDDDLSADDTDLDGDDDIDSNEDSDQEHAEYGSDGDDSDNDTDTNDDTDLNLDYNDEEIDDLTSSIQIPKGYSLPRAERRHLSDNARPRVAGEKHEVVRYYQHNADRGDPHYQVVMGQLFYYGAADVPQDVQIARQWFEQAAAAGRAEAHAHIGYMDLREGRNESAFSHLEKAASKDEKLGLLGLGYVYLRGIGTQRNATKAAHLFQKAANKHLPEAMYNLGVLYQHGIGVVQSEKDAGQWFVHAAGFDHVKSNYQVAIRILDGSWPEGKDCRRATTHLKFVAEQGNMWSTMLARALRAYERDSFADALYRYLFAAHSGLEVAQYNAAFMFEHGKVMNGGRYSVGNLLKTATRKSGLNDFVGSFDAFSSFTNVLDDNTDERRFWMMLDRGDGSVDPKISTKIIGDDDDSADDSKMGEKNLLPQSIAIDDERKVLVEQAMELYQMSAGQNTNEAMLRLGDLAYGEARDYRRAALAYEQAIRHGNAEAMFNLGMMHARGYGMNADKHMAKRYFDKAVEQHPDEARIPAMIALFVLRHSDTLEEWWDELKDVFNGFYESLSNMISVDHYTLGENVDHDGALQQGQQPAADQNQPNADTADTDWTQLFPRFGAGNEGAGQGGTMSIVKIVIPPDVMLVTVLLIVLTVVLNARQRRLIAARNAVDDDQIDDNPQAQDQQGQEQQRPVDEDEARRREENNN